MESYGKFAAVYDRLMDDFEYPGWAEYYLRLLEKAGCKPRRMCDCACGTGSMSVEFARRGIQVTGVDLSEEMLEEAAVKARRQAQKIAFVRQNMTALTLPRPVDAIVCACDGVNYLAAPGDLEKFLRSAAKNLKSGGVLAFDVSTRHKLEKVIGNGFFGEERDEVAYLWSNRLKPENRTVEMDLTFFLRQEGDLYRRFEEKLVQRYFDGEELTRALTKNGFEDVRVYGDRTFEAPGAEEMRMHLTARRI